MDFIFFPFCQFHVDGAVKYGTEDRLKTIHKFKFIAENFIYLLHIQYEISGGMCRRTTNCACKACKGLACDIMLLLRIKFAFSKWTFIMKASKN